MLLCVVDPFSVLLEGGSIGGLRGDDLLETVTGCDTHTGGRAERGPRDHGAQLDELSCRDVQRAQEHLLAGELDVAANVDGVPPRAQDLSRGRLGRGEAAERLVPFGAPDLEIHVDDVVVGDRDAGQAVVDIEGPELVRCGVVPDDAHLSPDDRRAECSRRVGALELGAATGTVGATVLADAHVVDGLPTAQGDLPVAPAERAGERVGDVLVDHDGAIRGDPDRDIAPAAVRTTWPPRHPR